MMLAATQIHRCWANDGVAMGGGMFDGMSPVPQVNEIFYEREAVGGVSSARFFS